MPDVVWIASHSSTPFEVPRVEQWAAAARHALPDLFGTRRLDSLVTRHLALLVWWDPSQAPATWKQVVTTGNSLAVNDGYPIGFDQLGLASPDPAAISDALAADPTRIERLQPPFVSVAIRDGALRLAIDAIGFAKVYRAQVDGLTVWASRASLAGMWAYGRAEVSIDGWTSLLSHDRFLNDSTSVAGVTLEGPRVSVLALDSAADPDVRVPDFIEPLFGHHVERAALPGRLEDALAAFHRSATALGTGRVRIPLSGGRDSRVVAATALAYGRVDEFWTSTPPELDMRLAERLVARLDHRIPWVTFDRGGETRDFDKRARIADTTAAEIWERLTRYQMYADGDGDTTPQRAGSPSSYSFDETTFWGLGSSPRAFYYDAAALSDPGARTDRFWASIRRGPGFVDPDARRAVLEARADRLRETLAASSLTGLSQLDYFLVFERMRRTKNRIGTTTGIRPCYAYDWTRAGLGQAPEERVSPTYFEEIVRHTVPAWVGIPYAHELEAESPTAATKTPLAVAFWGSPYVHELGRDLTDMMSQQRLVVASQVAALVGRPLAEDDDPVKRMVVFNRLLNYASYLSFAETLDREFRAAGGSAVHGGEAPVPQVRLDRSSARAFRGAWVARQWGRARSTIRRRVSDLAGRRHHR